MVCRLWFAFFFRVFNHGCIASWIVFLGIKDSHRERRRVHLAAREVSAVLHVEIQGLGAQVSNLKGMMAQKHSKLAMFQPVFPAVYMPPVVQKVNLEEQDAPTEKAEEEDSSLIDTTFNETHAANTTFESDSEAPLEPVQKYVDGHEDLLGDDSIDASSIFEDDAECSAEEEEDGEGQTHSLGEGSSDNTPSVGDGDNDEVTAAAAVLPRTRDGIVIVAQFPDEEADVFFFRGNQDCFVFENWDVTGGEGQVRDIHHVHPSHCRDCAETVQFLKGDDVLCTIFKDGYTPQLMQRLAGIPKSNPRKGPRQVNRECSKSTRRKR